MQVYVNDRRCEFPLQPEATLAEVLETLQMEFEPGHIVTEIDVDDSSYHAAESDWLARRKVRSVERLAVHTQSPLQFAADKRREVGCSLNLIADKARQAAQLFRDGEAQGANGLFAALMEELRLVLLLDQHLSVLAPGGAETALAAADIEQVARGLLEAQEKRAWRSVASLLEESLVSVLERWARSRSQPGEAEGRKSKA